MAQATERTAFADRVYLGKAEPKLKEVEIKSGTRKGEKETVLEFLCSKPSFTKEGKIASSKFGDHKPSALRSIFKQEWPSKSVVLRNFPTTRQKKAKRFVKQLSMLELLHSHWIKPA